MKKFTHLHIPETWKHYWTKYPEGYTILESLLNWVSQVNDMADKVNNLNLNVEDFRKELDSFIQQFDDNLKDEVIGTLEDWQESGFLDIVINEAIQTQLTITDKDLEERGVNVLRYGVVGDGVTDDTQALQEIINNNQVVVIPAPTNFYRITDTLKIPSYRKIMFVGNGHWNTGTLNNIKITYDGPLDRKKPIIQIAGSEPDVEPTADRSHVRIVGNVLLDGNGKAGYGLYAANLTNESVLDGVTATGTLVSGVEINKSWYAQIRNITARSNYGRGIVLGKHFWGGINGVRIGNLRAWGNGLDGAFTESANTLGCGVYISLGYGVKIENIVSERNYGAGVVYEHGFTSSTQLDTLYLEGNGQQAREEGKTPYNWGLVVVGQRGSGKASVIENLYLSTGTSSAQSVWLTGNKPISDLILSNISGGGSGVFKAEWDNYKLINTPFSVKITGHLPREANDIINSNYNTLYVRNNGDDENDGRTAGTAYATMEKAFSKLKEIYTITTINIEGFTATSVSLDFYGVTRTVNIVGNEQTKIGTTSNSSGLTLINTTQEIHITGGRLNRIRHTGTGGMVLNDVLLGHEDSAFAGTVEFTGGVLTLSECSLSGSQATNDIKNGIRLYRATLTMINTTVTDYGENAFTLQEGSQIFSNVFIPSLHYAKFVDGTGLITAGNRVLFNGGYVINKDE